MSDFSILHFLFSLTAFLLTFLILVSVHEFGHFIIARLYGVRVLRFSIGFGKPVYRWHDKYNTEYILAIFPFGGYTKLLDDRETKVTADERAFAFNFKPVYQRALILAAGPVFNILFSIMAFWCVFTLGITYVKPIINAVVPGSIAARAGLKSGEELIAIDGRKTYHWAAVSMALVSHYGEHRPLAITVKEPITGKIVEHIVPANLQDWHLNALRPNPLASLGVTPYNVGKQAKWPPDKLSRRQYSFFKALQPAVEETYIFFSFNVLVLYKMVTGTISWQSLGGPVSLLQAAVLAAGQGAIIFLNFLALLGVSVAVINLLPIPGLDGAQLLYLLYERLMGRPLSVRVQALIFRLGAIVIMLILAQALANDLLRLM